MHQQEVLCCEKPDSISFDDIHELLWKANTTNREKGFVLSTSQMSGTQLQNRIGADGHCFVALLGDQLVGTLSLRYINRKTWYAQGRVADYILAGVDPSFQGCHILTALSKIAFDTAGKDGCSSIELDTAENNKHAIEVYKHFGFHLVGYKANPGRDHYSVVMMKWLDKCPFSSAYMSLRFRIKRFLVKVRNTASNKK